MTAILEAPGEETLDHGPRPERLIPPLSALDREPPLPPEGLLALWLAAWAMDGAVLVHLARGRGRVERLARALPGLAPGVEVLPFPAWDCLPYDRASPSPAVLGRRVATLRRLASPPSGGRVVLTTIEACLQRVPPREALCHASFRLDAGAVLDLDRLRAFLLGAGYIVDDRVDEPGEAAIRGSVVDLFPAAAAGPYRLELEGERIIAIRRYDPLTQRSLSEVDTLLIEPASELLIPPELLAGAEAGHWAGHVLAGSAPSPRRAAGSEHLLPLAYPGLATVFDHLAGATFLLEPEHEARVEDFLEQVADAFASRRALARSLGTTATLVEPDRLYLDAAEWEAGLRRGRILRLSEPDPGGAPAGLDGKGDARRAFHDLLRARGKAGEAVIVAAGEEGDRRRLAALIERATGTPPEMVEDWRAALPAARTGPVLLARDLPGGFSAPGLTAVAAGEVLGRRERAVDGRNAAAAAFLPTGFRLGDHVVHVDHGIAVLRDVVTLEQGGVMGEYLALDFAGEDRLLVPVSELDRVWRYGSAESGVPLDRLDGAAWRARRAEVEEQLAGTAQALAELAARRARRRAPALAPPPRRYARFTAGFPFAETEDQLGAIEAVLADLARGSPPMDRLVCGDVGFGKTEVALRAAAVAALAGRQVALLAPTTVLVRQHLRTFQRRFAGLGVRVEQLSRLARTAEARRTRDGLADGSVAVVIGTHALASPGLRFKDLALVIIDEEQRFGARHKAGLRRLREGAHALTMTATPIPRTLQAALAGIQELSVLATAPVRRQPVRTYVLPFDPVVAREALLREHARGGRSFFVCPRIADIEPMRRQLAEIVPELDLVAAHGRMKAEALDDTVLAFAEGRHDVLLTTAIIETGLDIPGANTMIVWQAERFGMAQLHQLRGRVGRGRERASAYLFHDPDTPLPPGTERRLRTLETFEGLGAGFAISARDLDLRGAGDLAGEDQAGHLRLVGTELYQHLLERALRRARGETVEEDWSPELKLGVGSAVPPDYVPEPELRLDLHARLARLRGEAGIEEIEEEIADRFGPVPEAVGRILRAARLRLRCREAGVARLEVGPKAAAATFRDADTARRLFGPMVERSGGRLRWAEERLIYAQESSSEEERLRAAMELLDRLAG